VLTQWNTNRGELKSISFHPDGQRIATAGIDGTVCWWDLSGEHLGEWKAHQAEATSISCSPDGQIIATAGADGKAKLWTISGRLENHASTKLLWIYRGFTKEYSKFAPPACHSAMARLEHASPASYPHNKTYSVDHV